MSNFLFGLACITSLGKKGTFPAQLHRHLRTQKAEGGGEGGGAGFRAEHFEQGVMRHRQTQTFQH